ncbi:ethanolamine kinase 1-like isoform X2 [Paramacrobiotus metropolitanus]|uniref:ethanolamine kinase 1-like isoform X2 n=1 Tax=Paramacrobiotus metropolitanus TaxID=2943436 RepID=UPI0024458A9B|nr:ethanolamine kinase 1-like isoform X2 [Paramacrobiotus metropolitanus]
MTNISGCLSVDNSMDIRRVDLAGRPVLIEELTGGLINMMYKLVVEDDVTVFRIYNGDLTDMFDRKEELQRLIFLHEHGLYQKIYGVFRNGICYRYQNGRSLTAEELRDPSMSKLIARKLALLHTTSLLKEECRSAKDDVIATVVKNLESLPEIYENASLNQMVTTCFPDRTQLRAEFDELVQMILPLRTAEKCGHVVLCHNDLVASNIIFDECCNDVQFIDFEFSGYGFPADEIGGLFAEFFGATENGVNKSKEADRSVFQMEFIKCYLEARKALSVKDADQNKNYVKSVSEQDVWNFYVISKRFALLRPWFAVTWILNAVNRIRDPQEALDDLLFAKNAMEIYRKTKDSVFELHLRNGM